jgi:hypothetical protein
MLSVRRLCEAFGKAFGKPALFSGVESNDALISNGSLGHRLFGYPQVPIARVIEWTADWIARGGRSLGKPTKFERRDGKY